MKKILLLSDTHSHIDDGIIKHVHWADEVWHAGDIGDVSVTDAIMALKPLRAVYGNIDDNVIRMQFPEHLFFNCEDVKVWITHIGGYPGRYPARIRAILDSKRPDLFICGHSHILKVMSDKKYNLLHMNPGAAGRNGFHKVCTMLRFEVYRGKISSLEVVEFKR
ncbi:MAG: metallophosphoesterase family protein [Flavobacteriaceae bacterium]